MSIPLSALRLFHTLQLVELDWHAEQTIRGVQLLVVALLLNADEDLIVSSALNGMSPQDIRDLTTVEVQETTKRVQGDEFDVVTMTIDFPNEVYRRQSYTFLSRESRSLILARSSNKLDQLMIHWLGEFGIQMNAVKFESEFLMECLKMMVDNLPDQTKLGDVELVFNTGITKLGSISVELSNRDLIAFHEKTSDMFHAALDHLQKETSIHFSDLRVSKIRCQFLVLGFDGRVKFLKGMPMLDSTELIHFSAWDFIYKVFGNL